MDKNQLSIFRQRLEKAKEQLLKTIRLINEGGLADSMSDSLGELSLYDNNPADIGSELFERSKDFALREGAKLKIRAIDEALSGIEAGTYGICEICGAQIPFERLDAVPHTTTCYNCRQQLEKGSGQSIRPVEEEVIKEIYNQSFDESIDNVGYDNELAIEDRGYVEEVENIPYKVDEDGVIYRGL